MTFHNETTDHTVTCNFCFLWCLLFGFLYFLVKGNWKHALISFIVAWPTMGISWLIYPFFASSVMQNHYREKGYRATG